MYENLSDKDYIDSCLARDRIMLDIIYKKLDDKILIWKIKDCMEKTDSLDFNYLLSMYKQLLENKLVTNNYFLKNMLEKLIDQTKSLALDLPIESTKEDIKNTL